MGKAKQSNTSSFFQACELFDASVVMTECMEAEGLKTSAQSMVVGTAASETPKQNTFLLLFQLLLVYL